MNNVSYPPIADLLSRVDPLAGIEVLPRAPLRLRNCAGDADAFVAAAAYAKGSSVLLVVPDARTQERLRREITALLGEDAVAVFPSRDAVPYNMKSPFGPVTEERLRTLALLLDGERRIVIAPSASLLQRTVPPRELFARIVRIAEGDEVPQEQLAGWLSDNGFSRETMVEGPGQFAVRGGLLDVYPFVAENPLRFEFFGDTVETIREFDIFRQRSIKTLRTAVIFPMREFLLGSEAVNEALEAMEEFSKEQGIDQRSFDKLRHTWKSVGDCEGAEWFLHWFALPSASLLDYLPGDTLVFWDDVFGVAHRFEEDVGNYERHRSRVADVFSPFVSTPAQLLHDAAELENRLRSLSFMSTADEDDGRDTVLALAEQPSFGGNIKLLEKDLADKMAAGFDVRMVCETLGHAERLAELFADAGITVGSAVGYLERGFVDAGGRIAVYAEIQAFNRPRQAVAPVKKLRNAAPIASFDSLSQGDFVVHVDHGIGRFAGIERVSAGGGTQDCMVLAFHENAKVFVPVGDFAKVQKYIGKDGVAPALSRIGTAVWERQKEKTRAALRELAKHLVTLYAKRQYLSGISFPPDGPWQQEFEDAFVHEPTVDQLTAVRDIKSDMESGRPMDRLVCGDVGFGKTEVAMRASFKAASSGHQVAILAPTTILAAQHFASFSERMAEFPVRITLLSRFQKGRETKEELLRIADGSIDIVIGTHRLLSADVHFKNLGLLIIDEEQRFGVAHKEKLKEIRSMVDVLSLSATPIPRTMHMSLAGIRDLSLINTPPRNRLPVETSVIEYREEVLKTAIENELFRGGQAYVVHNRIKSLDAFRDTIERLVPQARVITAHGQMDEDELSNVMKGFVAGHYDVLLATTIIENGLDISNVNTIVIDRADTMGLSQLYQLRGRVGRSSEQAFAWFFVKSFREISELSLKRLKALEQFTDLGSGFQIAMRDLEIRGAGNLLGYDQHGSIAAVGFEMYNRLLREEIDTLMGRSPESLPLEVSVELPVQAYLPAEYIPEGRTRISVYQDCADVGSEEAVADKEKELVDRFGPLPEPAKALLSVLRIKILARLAGISQVAVIEGRLLMTLAGSAELIRERVQAIIGRSPRSFEVNAGEELVLKTKLSDSAGLSRLSEIATVLSELGALVSVSSICASAGDRQV